MQSPDHPELVFLEALQTNGNPAYTLGRPDGKPLWIIVHDMEATERPTCAEDTANYFHTGAGGRSVSSHYCCDDNSIVQCVRLKDSAWTVGNRPGNNRGINYELCGFASQTRDQWLDTFSTAMFARVAQIMCSDAERYGIPLERRTVSELKAWKPGVTSHNDLRLAFGGTTHTDPGSNFPWDYFIDELRSCHEPTQEVSMPLLAELPDGTRWVGDGVRSRPFTGTDEQWSGLQWAASHPGAVLHYGTAPNEYYFDIIGPPIDEVGPGVLVPHKHSVSVSVTGSGSGTSGDPVV